ncbi:MAG: regulatory protein GemA [Methylobacter tundripaludum]|nr:regulatory protein GemA [Methylobacter tundripaludum]
MTDLLKHYRQLVGIAKGWAEKNLLGWNDDIHRKLLEQHGAIAVNGRISASSLNLNQLGAVLDDYEQRGWVRHKTFRGDKQMDKPKQVSAQIGLMVKLWGRLGDAGKITKATRPALLSFCARQTAHNVLDLDSLTDKECQAIIEALKAMLSR